jgi:hypothetical protein
VGSITGSAWTASGGHRNHPLSDLLGCLPALPDDAGPGWGVKGCRTPGAATPEHCTEPPGRPGPVPAGVFCVLPTRMAGWPAGARLCHDSASIGRMPMLACTSPCATGDSRLRSCGPGPPVRSVEPAAHPGPQPSASPAGVRAAKRRPDSRASRPQLTRAPIRRAGYDLPRAGAGGG